MTGVDLTKITGIGAHLALELVGEIRTNVEAWATEKDFTSWAGLVPNNRVSGGKRCGGAGRRPPPVGWASSSGSGPARCTIVRDTMASPPTPPPADGAPSLEPSIEPGVREFCRLVASILRRGKVDGLAREDLDQRTPGDDGQGDS